jgi:hypothetical protein
VTARRLLELDTPRKMQIAKLPHTLHWPTPSVQAHSHKHKNFIVSTDMKTDSAFGFFTPLLVGNETTRM